MEQFIGRARELRVREALPWLYEREGVEAAFEIGEHWSPRTQIDVVGLRADGWTDLGECKWGTVRSAVEVERQLQRKAELYPNRRNATLGQRIFARRQRPGRRKGRNSRRGRRLPILGIRVASSHPLG